MLKKLKSNRGDLNSMLALFVVIVIITFAAFCVEHVQISWKRYVITNEALFVSRVAARQGGITNSIPKNWDSDFKYNTLTEVKRSVEKSMKSIGVDTSVSGNWSLTISPSGSVNHGDYITAEVKAKVPSGYLTSVFNFWRNRGAKVNVMPDYRIISYSAKAASEVWRGDINKIE